MPGLIDNIRVAMQRHAKYRQTLAELQRLSPREAADLGISVHDAHRLAREAVYGG